MTITTSSSSTTPQLQSALHASTNKAPAVTDSVTNDNPNSLTSYELYRAKNIERNQRRLADLGLITKEEAQSVIDSAWKKDRVVEEKQASISERGTIAKKGKGVAKKSQSIKVKSTTSTRSKMKGGEKLFVLEKNDQIESMWV
mmetsp:Transcript_27550/g.40800  ORF Transcript_27550/g.40800 Transcript_27550/m.40800 type:complete len:143 (-) Transcript_27550:1598-2026(-)